MDRRIALAVALISAGLAVAIVAVDLQFNVTVSLEAKEGDEWVVVASQGADGPTTPRDPGAFTGCAGPEQRLVIDNGQPWATQQRVTASVHDYDTGRSEVLVDETVRVAGGATQTIVYTVPSWALQTGDGAQPRAPANVDVRVGDTYLSTCVEAP